LFRAPIDEITLLHKTPDTWTNRSLNRGATLPLEPFGDSFHIQAEVSISDGAKLIFNLCGATLVLSSKAIESGAAHAPIPSRLKTVEILVDRTSIETFVNHGEVSSSRCFLPEQSGLSVKADGGQVAIHSLIVYPLNSAWEK
jgi:fructan beta-fructosidase